METSSTATKRTVEAYLADLASGDRWERHFAEDVVFTSHGTPAKRVAGRAAFLESTAGFYGMIEGVEVQRVLVDSGAACALTRYRLRSPEGDAFTSDVAELFTVNAGRIDSLSIVFDSAPYPG